MSIDFSLIRRLNEQAGLSEGAVPADPLALLRTWLANAREAGVYLSNAMVVSTVGKDGTPSSRAVLLKDVGDGGLTFFTNYESRKAREISENPRVACLVLWPELGRQVRITGRATRISEAESDAYFATRERGSRLEAWASPQSATLPDRERLLELFEEAERRFPGEVPRPPHWGGFRVAPGSVEFWQGRQHRMHDRLLYTREGARYRIERLAP